MRRILLFVMMNILVMTVVTILASLFGLDQGQGYGRLFMLCMMYGMVGSFISLQLSRWQAKKFMGVRLLDPTRGGHRERWLVQKTHEMAKAAGITTMPEVGIYESPEPNAFATGPSKNRSLVAVSTGLLRRMNDDEIEGVLAHEVAHAANGDMVTMGLLQGVVNAVVMFVARVIAIAIDNALGPTIGMVAAWDPLPTFRGDDPPNRFDDSGNDAHCCFLTVARIPSRSRWGSIGREKRKCAQPLSH